MDSSSLLSSSPPPSSSAVGTVVSGGGLSSPPPFILSSSEAARTKTMTMTDKMSNHQKYCYIIMLLTILFFPLLFFRHSDTYRLHGFSIYDESETGATGRQIDKSIESSEMINLQLEAGYIHYNPHVSVSSNYFGASSAYIDLRNLTYQLRYDAWGMMFGWMDDRVFNNNDNDNMNTPTSNDDDQIAKEERKKKHLYDRKVLDIAIVRIPSFDCTIDGSYWKRAREYRRQQRKEERQQRKNKNNKNNNDATPYVNPDKCSFQRLGIGYYATPSKDNNAFPYGINSYYDDPSNLPLQLCCSYEQIQNGDCSNNIVSSSSVTKNSNISIPYLNKDTFKGWYRTVSLQEDEMISTQHDDNLLIPIKESGLYVIFHIDCMSMSTDSNIYVNGTLQFKSSSGYLPGEIHNFLYGFVVLMVAYILLFLYWNYHWLLHRRRCRHRAMSHHHVVMKDYYHVMTTPFTGDDDVGNTPQNYLYQPVTTNGNMNDHYHNHHHHHPPNKEDDYNTTMQQQKQHQAHSTGGINAANEAMEQQPRNNHDIMYQNPVPTINHHHHDMNPKPSKGFILFGLLLITIFIGMIEIIMETSSIVRWNRYGGNYDAMTTNEKGWIGALLFILRSGLLRGIALLVAKGFGYTNRHLLLKHEAILEQQRKQRWLAGIPTRSDHLYYISVSFTIMMIRCYDLCSTFRCQKHRHGYHRYRNHNQDFDYRNHIEEPTYTGSSSNQYWYSMKLCFAYIGITELLFILQAILMHSVTRMSMFLIIDFSYLMQFLQRMKYIMEVIFILLISVSLYHTKLYYSLEVKERMMQTTQQTNATIHHHHHHHADSDGINHPITSSQQSSSTSSTVTILNVLQKLNRLTLLFRLVALIVILGVWYTFIIQRREYYYHYFPYFVYRAFVTNLCQEILYFIVLVGIALIIGPGIMGNKSSARTTAAAAMAATAETTTTTTTSSATRHISSSVTGNVGFMMTSFGTSTLPHSQQDPMYTELLLQEDEVNDSLVYHRIHHNNNNEDFIDGDADDAVDLSGIEL